MKKVPYQLILVVTLLISGVTVDAKTTKQKNSKNITTQSPISFGPSSIIKKSTETDFYDINDNLDKTLIEEGFSLIETKNENREIADPDGVEEVEVQVSYYENSKEGIRIEVIKFLWNDISSVEIKFTNKAIEKEFVTQLIKMGYKKQPPRGGFIEYQPPYDKGNLIWVSKNNDTYSVYYGG